MFKSNHSIDYEIKIDDKKIKIDEKYIKKDENDYYLFKVNIGENTFVFDTSNTFNKQKKVIKNFNIYEDGALFCISPIYIKNNDESNVVCSIDKQQTSYIMIK